MVKNLTIIFHRQSSHWTTQLDEVDQEIETFRRRTESWGEIEEDDDDCDGTENRGDNGYQSGSSKWKIHILWLGEYKGGVILSNIY